MDLDRFCTKLMQHLSHNVVYVYYIKIKYSNKYSMLASQAYFVFHEVNVSSSNFSYLREKTIQAVFRRMEVYNFEPIDLEHMSFVFWKVLVNDNTIDKLFPVNSQHDLPKLDYQKLKKDSNTLGNSFDIKALPI